MIPGLRDIDAVPLLADIAGLLLMAVNAIAWPLVIYAVVMMVGG